MSDRANAVRAQRSNRALPLTGLTIALLALLASGCALQSNPVNQEVALRAMSNGERVEASCELSNDHALWTVVAPVDIAVTRSTKPIAVECRAQNGASASTVFQAGKVSSGVGGGDTAWAYPERMELELKKSTRGEQVALVSSGFAAINETARVPHLNESGRDGYQRFLAGASPRAFAISEKGVWTRVNGSRGAERVALERCQAAGGRCRIYAIDDTVVWENRAAGEMVARNK